MSISAGTAAQSLHAMLQRSYTAQVAPMHRPRFEPKAGTTAGQQPSPASSPSGGGLLSADMLQMLQSVGS